MIDIYSRKNGFNISRYALFVVSLLLTSQNLWAENITKEREVFNVSKDKSVELKKNESISFEDLHLKIDDVVFEDIAGIPGEEESWPSGSGVVISITIIDGKESKEFNLSELTDPYAGVSSLTWNKIKVTLVEVIGYETPSLKLLIESEL